MYACDASSLKIYSTAIYCPMFVSFMVDYNTLFCSLRSIYLHIHHIVAFSLLLFWVLQLEIIILLFLFCKTDEPKDIGAQSYHPIDKLESSQNLDHEKDVKHEIVEDRVKSDALERKARGQESMEISGR